MLNVMKRTAGAVAAGTVLALAALGFPAAAEAAWSYDVDCAACHAEQVEAVTTAGGHTALPCATCHADEGTLTAVHDEVDADTKLPKRLKNTEVEEALCLSCHGDDGVYWATAEADAPADAAAEKGEPAAEKDEAMADKADATSEVEPAAEKGEAAAEKGEAGVDTAEKGGSATGKDEAAADKAGTADKHAEDGDAGADLPATTKLVAATADSEALVDSEGLVVNPHDLPDVKEHAIECIDCHKTHDLEPDAAKTASKKCLSCHHDGVYECYTCHA